MSDPLAAALAAQFNGPGSVAATYTPPGPGVPVAVRAIRSSDPAGRLTDAGGNPVRGVKFEIPQTDLAGKPVTGSLLVELDADGNPGRRWTIKQSTDLEFVATWEVVVEAAA